MRCRITKGMRHTFTAEQWLPYPVATVFTFFANPDNLPRLMPSWQKSRIERATFAPPPERPGSAVPPRTGVIAAGAGTTMTISFRPIPLSPVRISWDARITEFEWNDHFCDQQDAGPFAYWRHCHRIEPRLNIATGTEGSLLHDVVEYELPMGAIGEIANKLFVGRQLKSTFAYRQKRTQELLELATRP